MRYGLRAATLADQSALRELIARSIRSLGSSDYTPSQIEAALRGAFGLDTALIRDGTYFVAVTEHQEIVGCGGWSRRKTLFGSDARDDRDDASLNPMSDSAKIRAFFVHPAHARRGLGRAILERSEAEAIRAGFSAFELMATLPGLRLYEKCGYVSGAAILYPLPGGLSIAFVPMTKKAGPVPTLWYPVRMAESKIAVYGAIVANVAIAVTKFVVAGITGSSAMLSEGIHSAVDTFNGGLLLVGVKLSQRPATPEHPFGHGKELYFWSLIVAVLVFGLGGGVSFYEGVQHIRNPEPMRDPLWNYVVLGIAGVFEGGSFVIALRQFKQEAGTTPFWEALHRSKDPTTYTVLAEDAAALVGLVVAALGIAASHHFDKPALDGAASLVIGLLLAGVAVALAWESRSLLIGEGIRPETARAIRSIALAQPKVRDAGRVLSMYIGPDDVLVTMDLDFDDGTVAADVAAAIDAVERQVRERYPMIKRLFIEAGAAPAQQRWSRPDSTQSPTDPPQA